MPRLKVRPVTVSSWMPSRPCVLFCRQRLVLQTAVECYWRMFSFRYDASWGLHFMAHPAGTNALPNSALLPAVNWMHDPATGMQTAARLLLRRHPYPNRDSLIATIGVGYGDGYPRCLVASHGTDQQSYSSNRWPHFDGQHCPDVTDIPETTIRSTTTARPRPAL